MPAQTVMRKQIDSTHLSVREVADLANVSFDKLNRVCAGYFYLQGEEAERVAAVIWAARVRWSYLEAGKAKQEWDRAKAEHVAFEQELADLKEQVKELEAANNRIRTVANRLVRTV